MIDTNIIIPRENNWVVPEQVQELTRLLNDRGDKILVHPLSLAELKKHKDPERRNITLSKARSYAQLEAPPSPESDPQFYQSIDRPIADNSRVDDALLYAVHKNAVDFLVSEDSQLRYKSGRIGVQNRVFSIIEALDFLRRLTPTETSRIAPAQLEREHLYNIDIRDELFDSIKRDYTGFEDWFAQRQREGARAWIYRKPDGSLGGFMLLKDEQEPLVLVDRALETRRRVKIRTLKVSETGFRLGEAFLKLAIEFACNNYINELYVTAFPKHKAHLYSLLSSIGFEEVGQQANNEQVFVKRIQPERTPVSRDEVHIRHYPCFYLGEDTKTFLVPIRPKYHRRLFPGWTGVQHELFGSQEPLIPEGNAITKAYLSNSSSKKVHKGAILLFYRSKDASEVTSIGVVEDTFGPDLSVDEVLAVAGKRIVYTADEIARLVAKPALLILFRWHFHLNRRVPLTNLQSEGLLTHAPQSIVEITQETCNYILGEGKIDNRFVIHTSQVY